MIKIFLISGKAESGKNTVADFIANHYNSLNLDRNVLVRDYAFADEVKEIACRLGWDRRKDSKGRELLQQIGAWGRYYNIFPMLLSVATTPCLSSLLLRPNQDYMQ